MDHYLAVVLGTAVGFCVDVGVIPMGIAIGVFTNRWWQLIPLSVGAGIVHRDLVFAIDDIGRLGPFIGPDLIAAMLAVMAWSTVVYLLNGGRRARLLSS
jgi:hypothetical protein